MNTLYLYEDEATSKIALMVSRMVGMGACAFMNRLRRGSVMARLSWSWGKGETCSRPFPNGGSPFQGKP